MPRYFLNVERDGARIADEEGDLLPDAAAARALALDILREMQRLPHVYGEPDAWRHDVFVITDEAGVEILRVPYDALL